jgi:hypothetical protein
VALLDDVQHGRGFVQPRESREAATFHECLAIMRRTDAAALVARVRRSLTAALPELESKAAQCNEKWRKLQQSKTGVSTEQIETARKEALLQSEVAKYAARGLTSVAPMFLTAEDTTGRFVLIDGVARRAVRVLNAAADFSESDSLPQPSSRPPTIQNADHYYELEVFTPDSQNLPIVCCVPTLPDGFPEGDVIRQPVRVAGVFFKKWVYQTRRARAANARRDDIGAAPIVVAPTVMLLRTGGDEITSDAGAITAGVAFIACLALVWAVFWRTDRVDRVARKRRTHRKFGDPGKSFAVAYWRRSP